MNLLSIILQVTTDLINSPEAEEIKLSLWELAKDDLEYEAVIITYLLECEIEERKEKR